MFRFVQFEYPWLLGPADGRYVVRDAEVGPPRYVVVLATLGAPERRRLRRRRRPRGAPVEPGPTPVATGRATVVDTDPLSDAAAATAWLAALDGEAAIGAALAVLNRVIHAHRIASADPYVHELSAAQAIAIRAGYGDGERVADGRWVSAVELPPPGSRRRQRRAAALRPQERLAALLGARDTTLGCEELTLRARLDIDHDRIAAGALGARLALEAALVELEPGARADSSMARRLDELRELADGVVAAANTAFVSPLSDAQREAVEHAVARIEAALRARAAGLP